MDRINKNKQNSTINWSEELTFGGKRILVKKPNVSFKSPYGNWGRWSSVAATTIYHDKSVQDRWYAIVNRRKKIRF